MTDQPREVTEIRHNSPENEEVDLTVVFIRLDASDRVRIAAALSLYVVETRRQPGNRNVDLCASVGSPGVFVVIEKWGSPDAQGHHFDSVLTRNLAESCRGALRSAPTFDFLESISAHDLA